VAYPLTALYTSKQRCIVPAHLVRDEDGEIGVDV
jgi:hypothetical protein